MKRKITFLLAALLLTCGLSWAQTRTEVTDVLNREFTGVTGTSYSNWSGKTSNSEAVYAGNSAGGNESIQLRSKNSNSGIITTASGGTVTSISVTWNSITETGRTLNIYGKDSAYSSSSDLYSSSTQGTLLGTIVCGTSTELDITDEYQFIGLRSASGAMYLTKIDITWESGASADSPSLSADNVDITYDATSGSIAYTITNPVEGGVLSASTDSEWLTLGTVVETVPFTCSANEGVARTATVVLTYTYNTDQTVTKNVTVTQATNPNIPGTENNPYTVAQARAAIDAGTGTQDVYATGIVSAIVTEYSSTHGNITFDIVDEEGDTEYLRAYRCGGDDAADVAVGDVVVVYGDLTLYSSSIYEFTQGCQLVSLTHPVVTDPIITVTPATVAVAVEGGEGTLTVTYQNFDVDYAEVKFYDADGNVTEEYNWITAMVDDETKNVDYQIGANEGEARTAYMKVHALDAEANDVYSNLVTFSQEEYVADFATLPFSYDGNGSGVDDIAGLTQNGLGNYNTSPKIQFDNTGDWLILHFEGTPGVLSYDIKGNSFSGGTFTVQTSEDGETYTDLATYTELGGTQSEEFNNLGANVRYIKWIYTAKSSGNVALGNIMLAVPSTEPSITLDSYEVNATAAETEGTIAVTYQNLGQIAADVEFYESDGTTEATYDWIIVEINTTNNNIDYLIGANDGEARTAYFKVYALNGEEYVYSDLVTVNQEAYVAPFDPVTYTLATTIESGRHYIITNGTDKAMGAQNNNNRAAAAVTIQEGVATVNTADVFEFVINGPDVNGYYTIYDASAPGYLYAAGANSNNYLRTQTFSDNRGQWTISFDADTANIVANFEGRSYMRYNSGNDIFSCYASDKQDPIFLYVKDNDETYEFYKDIVGYGQNDGRYYLIASPVASVTPSENNGFTTPDFDLYSFDQTADAEWVNYKGDTELGYEGGFNLVPEVGYLYAASTTRTLAFTGSLYDGDGVVGLTYDNGVTFAGWNLIGNPYAATAYLADGRDFYVMNAVGTEVEVDTTTAISAMQGVFVVAANAQDNSVTFTTTEPTNNGEAVVLNVAKNRGNVIDRVIVRFGEGSQLPKFQLNAENTKVYIPQGNKDYAVVRSANEGEMPVSFKARENGSYTINVDTENVEMSYLHLIDNMTGADVDLLATPSYTFEANTNDYTSRFRLVFKGNANTEENENQPFAFFNGSEWVINNNGDAMLQLVDVTGRIVSNETISGNATLSIDNLVQGIYIMRLVNGNNVMTQKIVVR